MKIENQTLLLIAMTIINMSLSGQETTYYRSDKWVVFSSIQDLRMARDFAIKEKVVIEHSQDHFKVMLGKKILNYKVISTNLMDEELEYEVISDDNKYYKLDIIRSQAGIVTIGIEHEWLVEDIKDIVTEYKK